MNTIAPCTCATELSTLDPKFFACALVLEIHARFGASKKMIYAILMAVISHATQGLFRVYVPGMGLCRTSLPVKVSANSGLMKSLILDLLTKPLDEHQESGSKKYDEAVRKYDSEMLIWLTQLQVLKTLLRQAIRNKESTHSINLIEEKIRCHQSLKPQKPTDPTMIEADATMEAMFQAHPSVFLVLAEASILYQANRYKQFAPLSVEMYSGTTTLNRNRMSSGRISMRRKFMTSLLMSQEHVMYEFLDKHGELAEQIGELARSICCIVEDNRGNRQKAEMNVDDALYKEFCEKMTSLYKKNDVLLDHPDAEPEILYLSPEASEYVDLLRQDIEHKMALGGILSRHKAAASRICENVIRIASGIHILEGRHGNIELDILQAATAIDRIFFHDYLKLVSPQAHAERNAIFMKDWLYKKYITDGRRFITINKGLHDITPKHMRKVAIRDPAMNVLIKQEYIRIITCGGIPCLDLKPNQYLDEQRTETELFTNYGIQGKICSDPHDFRHPTLRQAVSWQGNAVIEMPTPAMNGWSDLLALRESMQSGRGNTHTPSKDLFPIELPI